jgi:hypothetical protein
MAMQQWIEEGVFLSELDLPNDRASSTVLEPFNHEPHTHSPHCGTMKNRREKALMSAQKKEERN